MAKFYLCVFFGCHSFWGEKRIKRKSPENPGTIKSVFAMLLERYDYARSPPEQNTGEISGVSISKGENLG